MDEQKKTSGSLALNGAPQVITIPPSDPVRDRKLRVAAYARVSSGSEDQLNSFAAQNAHYTELITDNPEWEFVDVYADKGITGTSAEKRDDFQRLLADCRRGRVDKILVKSSSRFARNAKECLEAVRELKALGVGVCFEEQGIDTSELAGELLTAIFAMMDQKESENISDNIRWSIQKRMARGTFVPSSLPFGYPDHAGHQPGGQADHSGLHHISSGGCPATVEKGLKGAGKCASESINSVFQPPATCRRPCTGPRDWAMTAWRSA